MSESSKKRMRLSDMKKTPIRSSIVPETPPSTQSPINKDVPPSTSTPPSIIEEAPTHVITVEKTPTHPSIVEHSPLVHKATYKRKDVAKYHTDISNK